MNKKLLYVTVILSGNDSDASQDMADVSAGNSPPGSVGSVGSTSRRKYRKKEFPRSEIKTRGAKLPNFALHMRAGHWTRKRWKTNSDDSYVDTRSSSSMPRYRVFINTHYSY
jgi:hypothetical protein